MTTPRSDTPHQPIGIEPPWKLVPGYAWGLRQSAINGRLRLSLPETGYAALDSAMAEFIATPLPANTETMTGEAGFLHRLMYWCATLQAEAHIPVFGLGHTWGRVNHGDHCLVNVAMPTAYTGASMAVLDWVVACCNRHLSTSRDSSNAAHDNDSFAALQDVLRPFRLQGVNNFRFLRAAHQLNLPVRPVLSDTFCFGTGNRARWMCSSYTDRTSVLGVQIAQNKLNTAFVLRQAGLPAATHLPVNSPEQAVQAARQLGYPVVVKPADKEQGLGVAANLKDDASVRNAFSMAQQHSSQILVERHVPGNTFRFTVLNGKVIKVVRRVPGGVFGDGQLTIAQLVARQQQDPRQQRRQRERGQVLLQLDEEALSLLEESGLTVDSIPAPQQFVCLRRRDNLSAGGSNLPVDMDSIHTDNHLLAQRAAALLQLDLAGIDFISPDISRSWLDGGAVICEVNAQPQIGAGTSPGIHQDILQQLLGENPRIPLMIIASDIPTLDWPTLVKLLPRGSRVGYASIEGVWLRSTRIAPAQANGFAAAQLLLATPQAAAAVVVMSPTQLIEFGLPCDHCDLLVFDSAQPNAGLKNMLQPHAAAIRLTRSNNGAVSISAQQYCTQFLQALKRGVQ